MSEMKTPAQAANDAVAEARAKGIVNKSQLDSIARDATIKASNEMKKNK